MQGDKKIFLIGSVALIGIVLCACSTHYAPASGVVAVYGDKSITQQDIDAITTGLNPEDSIQVAQQYIHQWAMRLIEYDQAKDDIDPEIEQMVEDYRRSAYVYAYEQRIVNRFMPEHITDSSVVRFYALHNAEFLLPEPIVKGVLLIIPKGAPHLKQLRAHLADCTDVEDLEYIEKYAYQYASGYELFVDQWRPLNQLLLRVPMTESTWLKQVRKHACIETKDSLNLYLMQVTEWHAKNDPMPLEYARNKIEETLLNQRQMEFLNKERKLLYEKAIITGKLHIYEK